MIPLPMIFLVMVVLTYGETPVDYHRYIPAPELIALVILSYLGIAAYVWFRARRAARLINAPNADPDAAAGSVENLIDFARWLTVFLTALLLWGAGWGALVSGPRHPAAGIAPAWQLDRFFFVPQLIFLTPAILTWLLLWAAGYQVEKAARQRALASRLQRRIPVHDIPSMAAYIWMQFRHNCILLIILTLAAAVDELLRPYVDRFTLLAWLALAIGIAKFVVFLPWLTTRLWDTTPLTGPLRQRLDAVAREHRLRFQNILLWKSHHMVSNAAILGFFPFTRYFLLSDALLERLTDRQIEAVFAHEVGHGKCRHFWWFAAVLAGAMMIADGATTLALVINKHHPYIPVSWDQDTVAGIVQLVLTGVVLVLVFLPVSKQFEHQADWFAVRHLARRGPMASPSPEGVVMSLDQFVNVELGAAFDPAHPPPPVYISTAAPAPPQNTQLTVGVSLFTGALFELVDLSLRSRDSGGPFHPSPNRRASLLYAMATSPAIARQFEKRMLTVRLVIALLLTIGIAGVILDFNVKL